MAYDSQAFLREGMGLSDVSSEPMSLRETPSAGILSPTAGYQFAWRGVSDGMGQNIGITRFRMPELRADRIEAQMAWDYKVVAPDLGYFFSNAVA